MKHDGIEPVSYTHLIESYKRKQRQNRSMSIRIEEGDIEHMSASSMGSVPSSYVGVSIAVTSNS